MTPIDGIGRLHFGSTNGSPACSKKGYEPTPPPEKLLDPQTALSKGGPELPGQVAAAMALNLVEFREQLGQVPARSRS